MGSVALGTCFLAKQMIMHSVVTFPVLMFVCIQVRIEELHRQIMVGSDLQLE